MSHNNIYPFGKTNAINLIEMNKCAKYKLTYKLGKTNVGFNKYHFNLLGFDLSWCLALFEFCGNLKTYYATLYIVFLTKCQFFYDTKLLTINILLPIQLYDDDTFKYQNNRTYTCYIYI